MSGCGSAGRPPTWPRRSPFLGGVSRWRELRVVHPARLIRRSVDDGSVVRAPRAATCCRPPPNSSRSRSRAAPRCRTSAPPCTTGGRSRRCRMPRGSPCPRTADLGAGQRVGVIPRLRRPPTATTCATASPHRCARCSTAPEPSRSTRPWPSPTPPFAPATSRRRSFARPPPERAGPGARQARRVAAHADGRAANPFESVLRALTHRGGLRPHPAARARAPGLYAVVDLGQRGAAARGGGRRVRAPRHAQGAAQGLPPAHRARRLRLLVAAVLVRGRHGRAALGALGPALVARRARGPGARRPTLRSHGRTNAP